MLVRDDNFSPDLQSEASRGWESLVPLYWITLATECVLHY